MQKGPGRTFKIAPTSIVSHLPPALILLLILAACALQQDRHSSISHENLSYDPKLEDPRSGERRLEVFSNIKPGISEVELTLTLRGMFSVLGTNRYSIRFPFTELLPCTNSALIAEWYRAPEDPITSLEIIFGVFSDARKTNLVDALWFRGDALEPVIDGPYNQALFALRSGETVESMYGKLGRRKSKYYMGSQGKWLVQFSYFGLHGRVVMIDADAGAGTIVSVAEGTL